MDPKADNENDLNEIERDIEATRRHLGRTLDALHDRLSIRQRVSESMHRAQDRGKELFTTTRQWVKQNRTAVVLVAAPVLLLLMIRAMRARRAWR